MSSGRRQEAGESAAKAPADRASSGAGRVASGIFLSRIVGFVRERAFAYFFGVGPHADVLTTAFRGPNLLQNLLGEGTVSAAFIPLYSRLVEEGREREAGRFAGAIFGLLLALAAALSLVGVLFARPIVAVLAPGFLDDAAAVAAGTATVDRFPLAVAAVKIIFPMTGILVLSAWALGVLNSHRRFFLPYVAPVLWNAAILAGLFAAADLLVASPLEPGAIEAISAATRGRLVLAACAGALVGGLLQFLVQVPLVVRLLRGFRLSFSLRVPGVRQALAAFGPVVAGRGVYQFLAYLDTFLASFLLPGALAAMRFALQLHVLPVSLFGLSVAAAELPELARLGQGELESFLGRVRRSLRQMGFLTVPTSIGYLAFGYLLVGTLFRTGEFDRADNWLVYLVLGGFTLGLVANTTSRLLQNSFYALADTRTPARIAVVRLVATAGLSVPLMLVLDRISLARWGVAAGDHPLHLGALGLAAAAAVGAWVELWSLRVALGRKVEGFGVPWGAMGRFAVLAIASAVPALAVWRFLPPFHVAVQTLVVGGLYAGFYLGGAHLLGFSELRVWLGRFLPTYRSTQ